MTSLMFGFAIAAAATVPAQSAGFATYFAAVLANGTVATSSGVASSTKIAVGKYEIKFNRAVNGCATLVSVNGVAPGYGISRRKPGTTDVLQVFLYSKAGALTDFGFNTLISCNS